jgi:hypothetical protein
MNVFTGICGLKQFTNIFNSGPQHALNYWNLLPYFDLNAYDKSQPNHGSETTN